MQLDEGKIGAFVFEQTEKGVMVFRLCYNTNQHEQERRITVKKFMRMAFATTALTVVLAACGEEGEEATDNGEEQPAETEENGEDDAADDAEDDEENGEAAEGDELEEGEELDEEELDELEEGMMEEPEVDLDDVPDPVAEVNGEPINKEDFEMQYNNVIMGAMGQIDPDDEEQDQMIREDIVEQLVSMELLEQEAEERGYDVDEEEVDEYLAEIPEEQYEQYGGEDELRAMIESEIQIEQLIEEEAGDVEVSDEDIDEQMEQIPEEQLEQFGGEDEMRAMLEQQLASEQQTGEMMRIAEELEEDADVEIHI